MPSIPSGLAAHRSNVTGHLITSLGAIRQRGVAEALEVRCVECQLLTVPRSESVRAGGALDAAP